MSFRSLRIIVLLMVFGAIAAVTYWERWSVSQWQQPLEVVIYPINGDGSDAVESYIAGLSTAKFEDIASFIRSQGERYRIHPPPKPHISLGNVVSVAPPLPPGPGQNALATVWWSLKMRYYVFAHTPFWHSLGQIKLFVVYHVGQDGVPLAHSLGLQKGLIGVIHAFARPEQNAQNNVIITHELLHTLGATDKYGADLMPLYPEGFAFPDEGQHYPQKFAEIMAGRIPLSPDQAIIPPSLARCVIGARTAYEIHW